ncbi:L-serine ammonia-lyase [Occallatibacter riparius]|uniref:L-serine dehydratase n=1 Tax=Occallatibacter riparius TaxID=1002689 RepID=A0A9J7BMQ7_9BACT|nr:L-serine ammonia-lyase [Occallatibacter riparius]
MTSLFDLYKPGVGPSSSHTMGPMRAAFQFTTGLKDRGVLDRVARVQAELYGSLALTGVGHATDRAVLLGLAGNEPATIAPESIEPTIASIRASRRINLGGSRSIAFEEASDLVFHRSTMFPPNSATQHPNGLRLTAFDDAGKVLDQRTFFSIGGGFITEDVTQPGAAGSAAQTDAHIPFPFHSAAEMLEQAQARSLTISQLMLANESARFGKLSADAAQEKVLERVDRIWDIMSSCIDRGVATEGTLPGGLNVRRRAHRLAERLREKEAAGTPSDPLAPLDWVTVWAMAVNEENAAGGRVVTAPTNGAAGVIPAVARYYERFIPGADREGMQRFFLTSAAIGILYKENASISGAEVGCQGEVGVACSMAAGGLTAALGGTNGQIEHAAEIGMEHNLGMTCDPIGGLVQIPCIERNAMGAVKAVQASRIAMNELETHKVSLDQVIRTMYLTGMDMQSRYKETSLAGLALNIIEC